MPDFTEIINQYMFPFLRISSLMLAAPIFGSQLIPVRVRILLSVLITFLISPLLPALPAINPLSIQGLIIGVKQVFIGVAIGVVFQFVFQIVVYAGQLLAMQTGLGFATLVDPQNHENIPVISQLYLMSVTLLFLLTDGHLRLISAITNSFYTLPIENFAFSRDNLYHYIVFSGQIFSGAIGLALPAIISLLMVNLTFAIMTKSAPQLNIFTIGFPLTLLFGLCIMSIGFNGMLNHSQDFFSYGFDLINQLTGAR